MQNFLQFMGFANIFLPVFILTGKIRLQRTCFSWLSTCSATSTSLSLQRCQVADAAAHRASGQSSLGAVQRSKQTLHQAQREDVPKNAPLKWDNSLQNKHSPLPWG